MIIKIQSVKRNSPFLIAFFRCHFIYQCVVPIIYTPRLQVFRFIIEYYLEFKPLGLPAIPALKFGPESFSVILLKNSTPTKN